MINKVYAIDSIEALKNEIVNTVISYAPNVISAAIILVVGIYGIRFFNNVLKRIMIKRELEPTLSNFVSNILFWTLRVLLFITVISQLGIGTSSFVAILGAAGLAVGLSLQGSLSNFSGGILIILFKPFRVNDVIEAQGAIGQVVEIQIFVTKIISDDNRAVFIPNGALSNGVITNYSSQGLHRANIKLSFSYHTNIKKVKDICTEILTSHPKVVASPAPVVLVSDFSDHAIHLSLKPYIENHDYELACSELLEQCKAAFDAEGIAIQPFYPISEIRA